VEQGDARAPWIEGPSAEPFEHFKSLLLEGGQLMKHSGLPLALRQLAGFTTRAFQTECGAGVDADHPVVRALMHAGFHVYATAEDSDCLLCKVVIHLPDGRVAVPEARRAIAMLDGIHPHSEPDLGFFRGYNSAILTIISASGKALTVKVLPPF
jgi:hypothetical protein